MKEFGDDGHPNPHAIAFLAPVDYARIFAIIDVHFDFVTFGQGM
jgi:hypothetical protein